MVKKGNPRKQRKQQRKKIAEELADTQKALAGAREEVGGLEKDLAAAASGAKELNKDIESVGDTSHAAAIKAGELQTAFEEATAAVDINNRQLQDTSLNLREQLDIQEDLVSNTQAQLKARIALIQANVEQVNLEKEGFKTQEEFVNSLIKQEKTLRLTRRYYNQIDSSTQGIASNIGLSYKWESSLLKSLVATKDNVGDVETGWQRMGTNLKGLLQPMELAYTAGLKLLEVTVAFNKELYEASITLNKSTAMSTRFADNMGEASRSIYAVGGTLGDAASNITTLVEGFSDFTQISDEGMITSLIATSSRLNAIGVSTEDFAASLQILTRNMGYSTEGAEALNKDLAMFAESIGMAPSKFTKEFALNMPKLEVYGGRAIDVFKKLEKHSKASGVGVDELISATAKMDTFEGAAEAAGQLNAALGGAYFDSLELLMAKEDERIDIIKDTINSTGIQFDQLGKFEQRLLAQAAGFEEVAKFERLLNGETDALNKQQKEFGDVVADSTSIMDSLKAIFMTLIPTIAPVIKSISQWLAKIAASEEKSKEFISTLKGVLAMMTGMGGFIFGSLIPGIKSLVANIALFIKFMKGGIDVGLTAADTMGGLSKHVTFMSGKWLQLNTTLGKTTGVISGFGKSITATAPIVETVGKKIGFFASIFEKVRSAVGFLFPNLKTLGSFLGSTFKMFGKITPVIKGIFGPLKFVIKFLGPLNFIISLFQTLMTVFDDIAKNGFNMFTPIKAIVELLLNMFVNPFISLLNLIPGVKLPKFTMFGEDGPGFKKPEKNATGTNFASGGLSLVGERGPEMVSLPKGSGVSTALKTSNTVSTQNDLMSKLVSLVPQISSGISNQNDLISKLIDKTDSGGSRLASLPRGSNVATAPETSNAMSSQNDLMSKLMDKIDNISKGDGKPIEINLVVDGRKLASVVHNNTEYLTI
tara:strand:+ start:7903 stop:10698 length:2796 start_codon:yes stop_codon:yes gene_type:complete